MRTTACTLAALLLTACGDGEQRADSDSASASATGSTAATTSASSSTGPAPTTGATGSASDSEASSGAPTTEPGGTSTGEATTTATSSGTTAAGESSTGAGSTSTSTGEFVCDPNDVEDTLAFTYVGQFDTGIPDAVLQASYYNVDADEVMIMSFSGKARRFMVDGTPLGEVFDVPPQALPKLDGATYDPISKVGLLINQDCVLNEVEPQTLAILKTQPLGFGMSICAGLAVGLDNNLYIASYGTDEMVTISRDGLQELGRVNLVQVAGLDGFDGIALIAGSDNFLVMSTSPTTKAAIVNPAGGVVVPASDLGQAMPPMIGGMPMLPDAVLTLCGNGHAWVCEAYKATCFDYAPAGGDLNACECLIPQ